MDAAEKSFDFAQEVIKQFLSLASAIPAIMITFSKDFVEKVPPEVKSYALWSWGFFLLSVLFGLLALMALTGSLTKHAVESSAAPTGTPAYIGPMSPNVRIFSGIQIVSFFIGLSLVVMFGWKAS